MSPPLVETGIAPVELSSMLFEARKAADAGSPMVFKARIVVSKRQHDVSMLAELY